MIRSRRPGAAPAHVTTARQAVSPASGKAAASSQLSAAGLGWTLIAGTTTRSANVPCVGEPRMSNVSAARAPRRRPRRAPSRSRPRRRAAMPSTPVTDRRDAACAVGAERHGDRRGGITPDPPVAAVERGGDEVDHDLAGAGFRAGRFVRSRSGARSRRASDVLHAWPHPCPIRSPRGLTRRCATSSPSSSRSTPSTPTSCPAGRASWRSPASSPAGSSAPASRRASTRSHPAGPNVIGVARGSGGGRTLLLNGHTDTVGHDGYERPLEPRIEGDRLYGRGSFDMKGGTAAALWACAEAAAARAGGRRDGRRRVRRGVREHRHPGRRARRCAADAAIVTEPTGLEVCGRAQGLRLARDRDRRSRRARLAAAARRGRDREGRPRSHRHRASSAARLAAGPGHALLGTGLGARLADRGRAGALELPRALPRAARAPHRARRGRRARRARRCASSCRGRARRSRAARRGAHDARAAALRDRARRGDRAPRARRTPSACSAARRR